MKELGSKGCPLCGGKSGQIAFPYATRFNGVHFVYKACSTCATVFVVPLPDARTFERMYEKAAYHDCHYASIDGASYSESARLLSSLLPRHALVLDYGCGTGGFLQALQVEGLTAIGVEFDEAAARVAARNLNCRTWSLAEFQALGTFPSVDAIHLGDVLEHLPDPAATLLELLRTLKPGGVLFLEGPLETNPSPVYWAARIFGWIKRTVRPGFVASHAPTHLFRTGATQQREFLHRVAPRMDLIHWSVYETGWPYANGGPVKRFVARSATVLGGRRLFGATFGNRFRGIFALPTDTQ